MVEPLKKLTSREALGAEVAAALPPPVTGEVVELWSAAGQVPMSADERVACWHSSRWAIRWDSTHMCWAVKDKVTKNPANMGERLLTGVVIVAVLA